LQSGLQDAAAERVHVFKRTALPHGGWKTQADANLQVQDLFNQLRDTQRHFNPAMARYAAAFLCGKVLKAPALGLLSCRAGLTHAMILHESLGGLLRYLGEGVYSCNLDVF
jgi:hypothetical protein